MSLLADAGVPMIMVYWPPAILALVPVILLEAWIGTKMLREPFHRCAKAAGIANLVSTLVGIPLAWLVLACLEFVSNNTGALGTDTLLHRMYAVTVQSPWLIPYEDDLYWMAPIAAIVLSVPFYFVSVVTEGYVAKGFFRDRSPKDIWHWTFVANVASYVFLLALMGLVYWVPIRQVVAPIWDATSFVSMQIAEFVYTVASWFSRGS